MASILCQISQASPTSNENFDSLFAFEKISFHMLTVVSNLLVPSWYQYMIRSSIHCNSEMKINDIPLDVLLFCKSSFWGFGKGVSVWGFLLISYSIA